MRQVRLPGGALESERCDRPQLEKFPMSFPKVPVSLGGSGTSQTTSGSVQPFLHSNKQTQSTLRVRSAATAGCIYALRAGDAD